jgi:hypothetical protein
VSFIVEKDGSLTYVSVARGVAEDIDAEAVRVMKRSPKWNPGIQNGYRADNFHHIWEIIKNSNLN